MKIRTLIIILTLFLNTTITNSSESSASTQSGGKGGMLVMLVAGIGLAYSAKLFSAASEQEKEAEKNIKHIEKIIATFEDSYAADCLAGRDDLKKPKCYCYTEDGKQNSSRSNSQICQQLWAKDGYILDANSKNYAGGQLNKNPSGCIDMDGNFDQTCSCRKKINTKTNENFCKKVSSISFNTQDYDQSLTQTKGLADLTKLANDAAQGNANLESLSENTLRNNAISNRQLAENIIKAINPPNLPVITEKNVDKIAKAVLTKDFFEGANLGSGAGGALGAISSGTFNDNPLIQDAKNKANITNTSAFRGSGTESGNRKKKNNEFVFQSDSNGNIIAGFSETKNYKYTNSDISTNSERSLFEIINNRYVQSGLKRLFDDDAK